MVKILEDVNYIEEEVPSSQVNVVKVKKISALDEHDLEMVRKLITKLSEQGDVDTKQLEEKINQLSEKLANMNAVVSETVSDAASSITRTSSEISKKFAENLNMYARKLSELLKETIEENVSKAIPKRISISSPIKEDVKVIQEKLEVLRDVKDVLEGFANSSGREFELLKERYNEMQELAENIKQGAREANEKGLTLLAEKYRELAVIADEIRSTSTSEEFVKLAQRINSFMKQMDKRIDKRIDDGLSAIEKTQESHISKEEQLLEELTQLNANFENLANFSALGAISEMRKKIKTKEPYPDWVNEQRAIVSEQLKEAQDNLIDVMIAFALRRRPLKGEEIERNISGSSAKIRERLNALVGAGRLTKERDGRHVVYGLVE
jgi:uncharacterized protein (DUF885 family)